VASTGLEPVFHRPVGELSKGFRQRVGLAAAILHRPDLLILDEPTEGLDPNQRVEIRRLIADLGRERTVLLSTHVLPEVQFTCSRLLIINQGRIVADGPVDQLIAQAKGASRISVEATGTGVADGLAQLPGVGTVEAHESSEGRVRVTVIAAGADDLRPRIFELAKAERWTLYELHQEAGSLEDLFRELTIQQEPV
jgi:ABC-2 type transport system ATP-binding protein